MLSGSIITEDQFRSQMASSEVLMVVDHEVSQTSISCFFLL